MFRTGELQHGGRGTGQGSQEIPRLILCLSPVFHVAIQMLLTFPPLSCVNFDTLKGISSKEFEVSIMSI